MTKRISAILGVGLFILWVVGLGNPNVSGWLTWLDGIAALCAFGIAGFVPDYAPKSSRMGLPISMSVALFVLWLVALNTGEPSGMTWWNFVFACAFLVLGFTGRATREAPYGNVTPTSLEEERERRRKSA